MQRFVVMLAVMVSFTSAIAGDSPNKPDSDQNTLQGTWECESGPANFLKRALDFKGSKVTSRFTSRAIKAVPTPGTFKLSGSGEAKTIDMSFSAVKETNGKAFVELGLYKIEGDVLTICTTENKRPTEFGQKGSNVNVYRRVLDDSDPKKGDLKKLQGKWTAKIGTKGRAVMYEITGNEIRLQYYEKGRPKDNLSGEVRLKESSSPKTIDFVRILWPNGSEHPAILGIYKLEGDTFTLCSNGENDEKNVPRPTEFTGKSGGDAPNLRTFTKGDLSEEMPEPAKLKTKKKTKAKNDKS